MKRFILVLMMFFPFILSAQVEGEQRSREEFWKEIESWKVAYFTQELCITPDEAAKFWPLYNEMTEQLMKLDWEKRNLRRSVEVDASQKREVDYMQLFHKMMDLDKKRLEVRQESYGKMVHVMPVSKVLKLDDVEERFRQKLFNYLRRRTHDAPPSKK